MLLGLATKELPIPLKIVSKNIKNRGSPAESLPIACERRCQQELFDLIYKSDLS